MENTRWQLLDQARLAFTNALSPVTASQWEWQTDCSGWAVGDLVRHVIGATMMYVALLDGASAADAVSGFAAVTTTLDRAGADFRQAADAVQERLGQPGAATRTAHHPAGDVTGNDLAGYAMVEWVLHGWDLSRATRNGTFIEPGLAQAIHDEIAPEAERLRRRGAFGPAVPVPPDAPAGDRLVALLGRTP